MVQKKILTTHERHPQDGSNDLFALIIATVKQERQYFTIAFKREVCSLANKNPHMPQLQLLELIQQRIYATIWQHSFSRN